MKTVGYAAHSPDTSLVPTVFERRDLRPDDVAIDILYCGVCHSDLHMARNDWNWTGLSCCSRSRNYRTSHSDRFGRYPLSGR